MMYVLCTAIGAFIGVVCMLVVGQTRMKKKQKIQKLIDLICEEEQELHDNWDKHHEYNDNLPTDLICLEAMCGKHAGSEWCEKHCNMCYNTPKSEFEKCIRHWILEEDT